MGNAQLWPGFFHGSPPKKFKEKGEIKAYREQVSKMRNNLKMGEVKAQVETLNNLLSDRRLLDSLEKEIDKRIDQLGLDFTLTRSLRQRRGTSAKAVINYYAGLINILKMLNDKDTNLSKLKDELEKYQNNYMKKTGDNFEVFFSAIGNSSIDYLVDENVNSLLTNLGQNLKGDTHRQYSKSYSVIDGTIDFLEEDLKPKAYPHFKQQMNITNTNLGQKVTITYSSQQKVDVLIEVKKPDGNLQNKVSLKNNSNKIGSFTLINELSRWERVAAKWYALSFRSKGKASLYERHALYIIGVHALIGQEEENSFNIDSNANALVYVSKDKEKPIKYINLNDSRIDESNFYFSSSLGRNAIELSSLAPIGYGSSDMNTLLKKSFTVHLKNLQKLVD